MHTEAPELSAVIPRCPAEGQWVWPSSESSVQETRVVVCSGGPVSGLVHPALHLLNSGRVSSISFRPESDNSLRVSHCGMEAMASHYGKISQFLQSYYRDITTYGTNATNKDSSSCSSYNYLRNNYAKKQSLTIKTIQEESPAASAQIQSSQIDSPVPAGFGRIPSLSFLSAMSTCNEDNVNSFPDTEFHTGSSGGRAPPLASPKHLHPIEKNLKVLSAEGRLPTLKVIVGWLCTNHILLTSWRWSPLSLRNHLCVLLNLLPLVGDLQQPGLGLFHFVHDLLWSCQGPESPTFPQLPEDIALFQHSPPQASQVRVGARQALSALSTQDEAAVGICFLQSFGHFATRLPRDFLRFDSKLGVFMSSTLERPEALSGQLPERPSRIRFFKDVIQLWLQREVALLEKTLRDPQTRSALTPYLFPDPRALCEHLSVIQQLTTRGKFFLIIPKFVVDTLYILRREDHRALAAITFLEDDLKRGNQYILCQSFVSKRLVMPRMTRPDSDAWDLYNILDFCKGLLDSSRPGIPDPSSVVTVITDICLDNPRNFSYPLQLVLGTATEAGMEIKNILHFHREWKPIS
ncbi:Protein SMG5 [Fukomys damarensis]|uniref:Nonsense-mediated mRNA decay factor SMG5 n=1 Tax=Fukomys damarensis TaxID=885580 RepID=A0A091DVZ0_FUKDA|nr:Protein SMG5 [Fukomys damarensis]